MLGALFMGTTSPDENVRHATWLDHVKKGTFSFGAEEVSYVAEGPGSWKCEALGEVEDGGDDQRAYRAEFLRSDWKLFHDALQAHRLDVMNHILPEYGICAG
jgi:hypothetical protein